MPEQLGDLLLLLGPMFAGHIPEDGVVHRACGATVDVVVAGDHEKVPGEVQLKRFRELSKNRIAWSNSCRLPRLAKSPVANTKSGRQPAFLRCARNSSNALILRLRSQLWPASK